MAEWVVGVLCLLGIQLKFVGSFLIISGGGKYSSSVKCKNLMVPVLKAEPSRKEVHAGSWQAEKEV